MKIETKACLVTVFAILIMISFAISKRIGELVLLLGIVGLARYPIISYVKRKEVNNG